MNIYMVLIYNPNPSHNPNPSPMDERMRPQDLRPHTLVA